MFIKSKWASLSFLAIILLNSCVKEKLLSEETLKSTQINSSPNNIVLSPGDGAYDALGWGYDATKEYANANSAGFQIIDIAAFKASNPTRITDEFPNSYEYKEDYGEEARAYSLYLSARIDATATFPLFKKEVSAGFSASLTASGKFDAKYVYGSYNLTIKQRRVRFNSDANMLQNFLTADFVNDVNTYYLNPQILVQKYGTHVLLDIYTGAKLNVMFQSETVNQNRSLAARAGIKAGVKDIFNIDVQDTVNIENSSLNYNRKLSYKTRGGDPSVALVGALNLDQSNPVINVAPWQASSTRNNAVLVDIGQSGMMLIYDLIADPVKKASVKTYVDQYLLNNHAYLDYLSIPIYEYYHSGDRDHYFTQSSITPSGYGAYGVRWSAYSYQVPNTVPIYRYYSYRDKEHYLSQSNITPYNFVADGIAFYAFPSQSIGTVPIYEYYSSRDTDHYYTKSSATPYNFTPSGVKFYAY
jgi:MAC/Perforin domain